MKITELMDKAWGQMGFPGDEDYWKKATNDELIAFGKYRALEDLEDWINENN